MYTLEEKAIRYVIKSFENYKRIKEDINMSAHSISVGFMLKDLGCKEEIIIAGLLHDVLEDTNISFEQLENNFGTEIANLVLKVSEDKSISDWRLRKENFINHLKTQNEDILLIEVADKLDNLLSDYDLWLKKKDDVFINNDRTFDDYIWYYLEMKKLFNEKLLKNNLLDRYNEITNTYFN